jgi:hypothetical protein
MPGRRSNVVIILGIEGGWIPRSACLAAVGEIWVVCLDTRISPASPCGSIQFRQVPSLTAEPLSLSMHQLLPNSKQYHLRLRACELATYDSTRQLNLKSLLSVFLLSGLNGVSQNHVSQIDFDKENTVVEVLGHSSLNASRLNHLIPPAAPKSTVVQIPWRTAYVNSDCGLQWPRLRLANAYLAPSILSCQKHIDVPSTGPPRATVPLLSCMTKAPIFAWLGHPVGLVLRTSIAYLVCNTY